MGYEKGEAPAGGAGGNHRNGINLDGNRDVLGLWVGTGGEGASWWRTVLTELRNRGIGDVCIVCCGCDGLKGLPGAIETT